MTEYKLVYIFLLHGIMSKFKTSLMFRHILPYLYLVPIDTLIMNIEYFLIISLSIKFSHTLFAVSI